MTTYLGKSCSFCLPRGPFVNCRQFMYLVISLLVLRAGYGIWLYQFLIIAYLFILLIFLKLCRCFLHGVRMCMWFGYNCWIILFHFFYFVNLVIFRPQCIDSGYLVSATPHTILYQSFWNFAHVFSMVLRCAYGLDIILAFIFVTFSTLRTLSFSDLRFYENVVTVGTLWAQLLLQFYTDLFETLYMFSPWSGDVHVVWIWSLN